MRIKPYKRGASPDAVALLSRIQGWQFAASRGLDSAEGWANSARHWAERIIAPGCEPARIDPPATH